MQEDSERSRAIHPTDRGAFGTTRVQHPAAGRRRHHYIRAHPLDTTEPSGVPTMMPTVPDATSETPPSALKSSPLYLEASEIRTSLSVLRIDGRRLAGPSPRHSSLRGASVAPKPALARPYADGGGTRVLRPDEAIAPSRSPSPPSPSLSPHRSTKPWYRQPVRTASAAQWSTTSSVKRSASACSPNETIQRCSPNETIQRCAASSQSHPTPRWSMRALEEAMCKG